MAGQFIWIDFYMEFATKLLASKNNRKELIEKIQKVYKVIGIRLPKLENTIMPVDIDPFTVFGLFNKGITDSNRKKILGGIKSEFDVNAQVPDDFSGIPVLNNLMATFYGFEGHRETDDIDNLWILFESALKIAESDTSNSRKEFISAYNRILGQKCIRWNITMGLYWIRPYEFINLDSKNRGFLSDPDHMPANVVADASAMKTVPTAEKYLELRDECMEVLQKGIYEYKTFPELSYTAWLTSKEEEGNKDEFGKSKAAFLRWFKPVITALRDLGGSAAPSDVRKKIIENEHLSEEEVKETRGKSNVNKFENEVAFARSYLVKGGYIDNSVQGIWSLSEKGMTVDMTDDLASDIFKAGRAELLSNKKGKNNLGDADVETIHYWLYSPGEGAVIWDECYKKGIMAIGWDEIGDLSQYATKTEMKQAMKENIDSERPYTMAAHATWQFANEMNIGDIVFAKKGRSTVIGRGVVMSEYEFDDSYDDNKNIRKVNWTHKGEWQHPGKAAMKTLTDITSYTDYVEKLKALFESDEDEDVEAEEVSFPSYSKAKFLDEVYMEGDNYDTLVGLVMNKRNVILQGAPGVGKTYAAKRLAYSIMGVKDPKRVMMVQFHQSYSYEDFIMGFRPSEKGFELKRGAFYNFCKDAEIDSENEYFFIIDEINRGNLSKIFGELFMLIENDKRGVEIQLLYSDEKFSVPDNVYIIGMMNTADRSLAMLDYALRRRFAFYEMKPGFNTNGFRKYRIGLKNKKFDNLIQCVEQLNAAIAGDESLGEGFCIGHSYFCNLTEVNDQALSAIVEYELIPLLKEYWFDEPVKVKNWAVSLRSAIK